MSLATTDWTLADMLRHVGVPPKRIRFQPPPGTATEQDVLDVRRRTGRLCELVDGILVEKVGGYYESVLAVLLLHRLQAYLEEHPLGVLAGEAGMLEILAAQIRIPDVSFIRWERFPGGKPSPTDPMPSVAPDLAVEILSAGNTAQEMQRKLREYFAGGSRQVWYIDPQTRLARVYTSPEDFATIGEDGHLTGGDVLPGFQLRLGDLFAAAEPAAPK